MVSGVQIIRWGDLFALSLAAQWAWSEDDGVISIFRSEGVGALQLSIVTMPKKNSRSAAAIARQLAETYASQRAWDVAGSDIRITALENSAVSEFGFTEHGDNPTYWQVWHVVGDRRAAFITYTCDPKDAEIEAADRRKIVESFQWL